MVIGCDDATGKGNDEWRIDSTLPAYIWIRVDPEAYRVLKRARGHYCKVERNRVTLSDTIACLVLAATDSERGLADTVYRPDGHSGAEGVDEK